MSLFWVSLNILFAFFTGGPVAGLGMAVLSAVTFHTARRKGAKVKYNNHFTLLPPHRTRTTPPRWGRARR